MKDFEVIGRRFCELCEREIGAGDLYSCSKSGASDRSEFRKKVYEFGSFFDSWEKRLLKAKKAWLSNLTSN